MRPERAREGGRERMSGLGKQGFVYADVGRGVLDVVHVECTLGQPTLDRCCASNHSP